MIQVAENGSGLTLGWSGTPQFNLSSTSADVLVQLNTSAISPLALAAIGNMALVSNCTTTSADVEEDWTLVPFCQWGLAPGARWSAPGVSCQAPGVAVAKTYIAARDGCGYWRSLAPGVAAAVLSPLPLVCPLTHYPDLSPLHILSFLSRSSK